MGQITMNLFHKVQYKKPKEDTVTIVTVSDCFAANINTNNIHFVDLI